MFCISMNRPVNKIKSLQNILDIVGRRNILLLHYFRSVQTQGGSL